MLKILKSAVLIGLFYCASSMATETAEKVFELRTYKTHPGKLQALEARFRDHTTRIFSNHGMQVVAYWTPTELPEASNTLIYVLSHASRAQADKNWKAFIADPEWKRVAAESQKDGKILVSIDRVYMQSTDFSPMR